LYILAGQEKLRELDEKVIPALRRKAEESGDMLDAQALRDVVARRDDLERRVHDLMLTRQVTLQSLPQIRLIQDVDKSLVNKIQSSILTTIPVWKSQIAMAITLWNQQKALETQKKVTDTTNEMLERNAELLRMGSAEARKEIERGIFDIEAIKKVNNDLIATIQESIQITQEGKRRRQEAEAAMAQMEE
ncbi:MAG: toxic anion resistance protein, partial [Chloroflexi bacterium]|nr:toxic anion resistance protein [Chloroflexota bacterium]